MENTNFMDFKSKCELFEKMGKEYKRAKIVTTPMYASFCSYNMIREDSVQYPVFSQQKISYYEDLKKICDLVLTTMKKDLSMILAKDFFETEEDNWWNYYFSRSTYYRLKNIAMDVFMDYFRVG